MIIAALANSLKVIAEDGKSQDIFTSMDAVSIMNKVGVKTNFLEAAGWRRTGNELPCV